MSIAIKNKNDFYNDSLNPIKGLKQKFDALNDKGEFAIQMKKLANVGQHNTLHHLNWHHPRKTLAKMNEFRISFNKLSDVCRSCSHIIINTPGISIPRRTDEIAI